MEESKYSSKVIAETGLMFTIIFLIVIMTSYIPVLSSLGMFILPIPITVLYIKHGYKIALISVVMSIILTSFILDPITAVTSGITYGIIGNALGYSIKNNKSSTISIITVAIASAVGNIVTFMIYAALILNKSIIAAINLFINEFREQTDLVKEIYISMNASPEIIQVVEQFKEAITLKNVVIFLPMYLIVLGLVTGYLNYLITEKILKRLNFEVREIIPFSRIYIPNKFAALLIIIQCIGIILYSREIGIGEYMATIGAIAVQGVFILSGMAHFAYLLIERAKMRKKLASIILVILSFIPMFLNAFSILGLMDIIFNLRKLDPNPIRIIKSRK